MQLREGKKIYFASDMHFGIPNLQESQNRERKFCRWLDMAAKDAHAIFLIGDIFDFWMEYKRTVPKGYSRFFGKLSELTDAGIEIHYMRGNHDTWLKNYLADECGCIYDKGILQMEVNGKKFYIHHGDGLAPKGYDTRYKMLKKLLNNKVCIWLYSLIHPSLGIRIALFFSRQSRMAGGQSTSFESGEKEWLTMYSKDILKNEGHFDFFIFGHRHLALDIPLNEKSKYVNLGDWLTLDSYGEFDGTDLHLKYFEKDPPPPLV